MTAEQHTLEEWKIWLRDRVDVGVECPLCEQFAKVYRRKIHAGMAADLIRVYARKQRQWHHVRTVLGHDGGDYAKLQHWGLIVESGERRADGSTRAGWWAITAAGEAYVHNQLTVPKYARLYAGRCLNLTGDLVSVRDALGKRFNYAELMAGV